MSEKHFVKVTAHRGVLIIETLIVGEHPDWVPLGPDKIGCVLINTKAHLAVSEEAFAILETLPKSHDSIGDVDWADSSRGRVFSWLGGQNRFVDPLHSEGSRDHMVWRDDCTIVPNVSNPEAVGVIDARTRGAS